MRTIEYRIWNPKASPFRVEFSPDLMRGLGIEETAGILYGTRREQVIRILSRNKPHEVERSKEEQEKVGVFVSRIRGEVFLTETDLAFFKQQQSKIALVVAGRRAGFFVTEADGSIQAVRSHEEFSIAPPVAVISKEIAHAPQPRRVLRWTPAGLVALAALPIAALAVFPQRTAPEPSALAIREIGGQLRISWKPGQNAVLAIEDGDRRLAIPVYANQSNVTYAPRDSQVEVSLVTMDAANKPRRESALYMAAPGVSGR
jgi:hypothetical protein